jgi:superfamily I DNA/RNA helicase
VSYELPDGFDAQRDYLIEKISSLIERERLMNVHDAILLDEAHDYIPAEIRIFSRLAKRLFLVADSRQKIYPVEDSIDTLAEVVDDTRNLRYHYRTGRKICQVADGIAKKNDDYEPLIDTSNYNERANPSIVEHFRCNGIDDEADRIVARLDAQLKAFPGELIGIVCPKREDLLRVWAKLQASPFADSAVLQLGEDRLSFDAERPIILCTFHAAKGLEVRSLHMAGCDTLKRFSHNRNMAFTAVTRAKTSLTLYYSDVIHPYLEGALGALTPMPDVPDLDDVFGQRES